MKKNFLVIIFAIFINFSANAQTMIPLNRYLKENDKYLGSPSTQNYIWNRCAAVSLYIAGLIQDKDKETSIRFVNDYDSFSSLTTNNLKKNLNFSNSEALKNFTDNVTNMLDFYRKDSLEFFARTGDYIMGNYIGEDAKICREILKK
jgi:hypothetical protein